MGRKSASVYSELCLDTGCICPPLLLSVLNFSPWISYFDHWFDPRMPSMWLSENQSVLRLYLPAQKLPRAVDVALIEPILIILE